MKPTVDLSRPLAKLLAEHKACSEAIPWSKQYRTAAQSWEACQRPDWMLWGVEQIGYDDDSKLRLYACWCVRNTPLVDGRTTWDLLLDDRSKAAVEVAERFAHGQATNEELAAPRAAAWAAANVAWDAANAAANAAGPATRAAANAARAARAAAWTAQADALRVIIGNPFEIEATTSEEVLR